MTAKRLLIPIAAMHARLYRLAVSILKRMPLWFGIWGYIACHKAARSLHHRIIACTYYGAHIECNPNDLIQQRILYFGVWEPDVSDVIAKTLEPGDVFVDLGANVGYDTLLGATLVGPSGMVVAVEALPSTFLTLQRNLRLNPWARSVRAVNCAVAAGCGMVDLYEVAGANIGATTSMPGRGGHKIAAVQALPLDEILRPDEMRRTRLIKIDVEGAEPPILAAILDGIEKYPEFLEFIVEVSPADARQLWDSLFSRFVSLGFEAYGIDNQYGLEYYLQWRRPAPLRRLLIAPTDQIDVLFTKQLNQRLRVS